LCRITGKSQGRYSRSIPKKIKEGGGRQQGKNGSVISGFDFCAYETIAVRRLRYEFRKKIL
jgi:hypothetical protein